MGDTYALKRLTSAPPVSLTLLSGTLINYQTVEYASLAYMAPKLKKLTLVAVTQFLKDRIEYVFNIDQMNTVRAAQLAAVAGNADQQSDFIIEAILKSCIDNDLLRAICKSELKVSAADVTEDQLHSYQNDFSKDPRLTLAGLRISTLRRSSPT